LAVASLHSDLLDRNRKLSQNRLDFVPFLMRKAAFKTDDKAGDRGFG
jgi:hypothetical protein